MNAVDTNILVYSLDRKEPVKQLKAQQLLRQLVSWQALGEFLQQLRRWKDNGQLTEVELVQHMQVFRSLFPVALPT
jgi:predicted nucleic acid-binding protein